MCGINGFVGEKSGVIDRMNGALMHRGPDFCGTFSNSDISLGHTLLSIRSDIKSSKQPYMNANSPWVLVYNGQLYNTSQLKKFLAPKFESESLDTALLYGLIEKFGWNFIEKIHGMFAIALYNKDEKVLKLYRDPSGQKGIYYYRKNEDLVFASEIKSIIEYGIDKTLDSDTVSIALNIGFIPGHKTLFKFIHKLNPSEELTFNLGTKKTSKRIFKSNLLDYYENSSDVFASLTSEHMQSKEKVSLNLSGGLDSSLLLHEMSELDNSVTTYTNRFEDCDEKYNIDADLAQKLATHYGTDHTEIFVRKSDFYNNFVESIKTIEEPNYNISLATYLTTAKHEGINRDKKRVVLSGDGGDELFGGYPYYLQVKRHNNQMRMLTTALFSYIRNNRDGTKLNFKVASDRWLFTRKFNKSHSRKNSNFNISEYLNDISKDYIQEYAVSNKHMNLSMLLDRLFWLANENFLRSDKLYMSQSLEIRSPLSYMPFRLHFDKKLKNTNYIDKNTNKKYLRNYYSGKLPDYIVNRNQKSGWRAPIESWYDKKFKDLFISIIDSVNSSNTIVDWNSVKKEIEDSDSWPGKHIHLYISLAILSKEYNLDI